MKSRQSYERNIRTRYRSRSRMYDMASLPPQGQEKRAAPHELESQRMRCPWCGKMELIGIAHFCKRDKHHPDAPNNFVTLGEPLRSGGIAQEARPGTGLDVRMVRVRALMTSEPGRLPLSLEQALKEAGVTREEYEERLAAKRSKVTSPTISSE